MTKKMISLLLAAAMCLSLSACGKKGTPGGPGDNGERVKKETMSVVLSSEPVNLNPQTCNMLNGYIVEALVYDTLLQVGPDGEIQPNLATEWEMIDDTHIRFKLREDAYFSSGEQMTSEDVVFTLKRCTEMSTTKSTFKFFDGENTKADGDFAVIVALKQPFAPVYSFLTHAYSSIVCKSYVEEVGDEVAGLEPIGTGAYVVDSWVAGSSILLKRNDKFWGEPGASDKIEMKVINEVANRAIELETGSSDIALDISANDGARIAENYDLKLMNDISYRTTFLGLNLSKDETANAKIREALSCALDIELLTDVVYEQYGIPADSIMSSSIIGHSPVSEHVYDVERAKKLLAEAGYPNGINLTGRCQTNVDFKTIAEIIQNMWKEAGINCEIQVLDKATYNELGKANNGTNITITSQTATTGNAYQAIGTVFSTASRNGIINSSDTKLDEMIAAAAAEYDDAARAKKYEEIQDYIVNNYYAIPIAFTDVLTGMRNTVEGYVHSPANTPDLTYVCAYE